MCGQFIRDDSHALGKREIFHVNKRKQNFVLLFGNNVEYAYICHYIVI